MFSSYVQWEVLNLVRFYHRSAKALLALLPISGTLYVPEFELILTHLIDLGYRDTTVLLLGSHYRWYLLDSFTSNFVHGLSRSKSQAEHQLRPISTSLAMAILCHFVIRIGWGLINWLNNMRIVLSFKESLNKLTPDVHKNVITRSLRSTVEVTAKIFLALDLDRHRSTHSRWVSQSQVANGISSTNNSWIEQKKVSELWG